MKLLDILNEQQAAISYHRGTGTHQTLLDKLQQMIPHTGSVDKPNSSNRALNTLRRAINSYYDLYNNGLINRAAQFSNVFGIKASLAKQYASHARWSPLEQQMDQIIMAAAIEQGLVK